MNVKPLSILCALTLLSGSLSAEEKNSTKSNKKDDHEVIVKTEKDFDRVTHNLMLTFSQVIELVRDKHVNTKNLFKAFVKGMDSFLNTLDPHSSLLDPKAYKLMLESMSGEFFGIGVQIDNTRKPKDRFILIVETIPGGPADKEGLQDHDKIVAVNDEPLEGMSTEEAIALIKGPKNTKVELKVMREGQPDLMTFKINRDVVREHNSLSFEISKHNIYYLSLSQFTETAIKQIESLLKQASNKNYKGIILDLRNNSGGLFTSAINIAELFLPKKSLVVETRDKGSEQIERHYTSHAPIADPKIPIFILINNYTASAAEILAGALKQHANSDENKKSPVPPVFLVGTRTFGKGSVQEVMPISNQCAAKITISLYYLPNNMAIQGIGIEPDFKVERLLPLTEQMKFVTDGRGEQAT